MTITLNQALTMYNWFLSAVLVVILLMIARFYELKTHERTYFRIFVLPLLFFGVASLRSAYLDQAATDDATATTATGSLNACPTDLLRKADSVFYYVRE